MGMRLPECGIAKWQSEEGARVWRGPGMARGIEKDPLSGENDHPRMDRVVRWELLR
ncbi:MAG: hypothetical protein NVS4B8_05450 [Herpetosiphon sp.]